MLMQHAELHHAHSKRPTKANIHTYVHTCTRSQAPWLISESTI